MNALLIVDVQNDFIPGGALPVTDGHLVVGVINKLLERGFDYVIASKDWHPKDHMSFADNHEKEVGEVVTIDGVDQILWPVHCVEESLGAEFVEGLRVDKIDAVIYKGTDKEIDSYSAFFDNNRKKATQLESVLKEKNVDRLYVCGLATDYCVKFTVLDALDLGFDVYLVADGCRGVNLKSGDSDAAIEEVRNAGAHVITSDEVLTGKL